MSWTARIPGSLPSAATEHWMALAECREAEPSLFDEEIGNLEKVRTEFCGPCPVFDQCRAFADAEKLGTMIYAGETPDERKDRRKTNRPAFIGFGHARKVLISSTGYTTGQVFRLTGATDRQLRYWDQLGLCRPSIQQSEGMRGRTRLYSDADVERVKELLGHTMRLIRTEARTA